MSNAEKNASKETITVQNENFNEESNFNEKTIEIRKQEEYEGENFVKVDVALEGARDRMLQMQENVTVPVQDSTAKTVTVTDLPSPPVAPSTATATTTTLDAADRHANVVESAATTTPTYAAILNTALAFDETSSFTHNRTTILATTTNSVHFEDPQLTIEKYGDLENDKEEALSKRVKDAVDELTPPTAQPLTASAPTCPSFTIPKSPTANLSHSLNATSESAFGVELRRDQQQRKIKIYHDAKQSAITASTSASTVSKCSETVSASGSPSMVRKSSYTSLPRRVSFPKNDKELVTGYLEPANPWEHVYMTKSISEICELYVTSCNKHKAQPLQSILDHLKVVDLNQQLRQPVLSLKSINLSPSDCESLEEIFKRIQYKFIDISSCALNESAACALFEMMEFYEATNELDISSNNITMRGWTSCSYMVGHSRALQVLNAEGNPVGLTSMEHLGNALMTSNLHTLKLEHCGLKGNPLVTLCCRLHKNQVLKELWLAYNDLNCSDAQTIANLLKSNHYLELVDISNNNITDNGLWHLVHALIQQSTELEHRSTLQRSAAVDDDDNLSPEESMPDVETEDSKTDTDIAVATNKGNQGSSSVSDAISSSNGAPTLLTGSPIIEDAEDNVFEMASRVITGEAVSIEENNLLDTVTVSQSTVTVAISAASPATEDNEVDEDTEDTTVKSSTIKNPTPAAGQSMLDKLLSMNSDSSSSEDGASNLSTDTVAACYSEDTSIISDDIFDAITNNSTHSKCATSPLMVGATMASATVSMAANSGEITRGAAPSTLDTEAVLKSDNRNNDSNNCNNISAAAMIATTTTTTTTNGVTPSVNNNSSNSNSSSNNKNNNNNNNNQMKSEQQDKQNSHLKPSTHRGAAAEAEACDRSALPGANIFEVTAEESDCHISSGPAGETIVEQHTLLLTKALDVNKNTKLAEDYDDTHSLDSAFESASEGDISRHLPEEFTRLSASFESTRLDDIAKELPIETATIATESTECLAEAATPTPPTPPLIKMLSTTATEEHITQLHESAELPATTVSQMLGTQATAATTAVEVNETQEKATVMPKVTIAENSLSSQKHKEESITSPSATPPPPSTSPGGASAGLRRTESSCAFITPSTRNRSQSSDSLYSDNSLDGSISSDYNYSTSAQLNEKLTKNDTLTRQQRQQEPSTQASVRAPAGLKALALWNNNLTREAGHQIAALLANTSSLELLNIGKNCLSNDFITFIKESLMRNTTLTTLGLQSAHLSAKGIETLSSVLTFGGNSTLQRIDIRGNKIEVDNLSTLADALKSNTTVTQIDIDDEPKRLSVGSDAHMDYARVLENVRSMCSRNEKSQAQVQAEKTANVGGANKRRGGYYVGSRKISLTCHSRPLIESIVPTAVSTPATNKLDVKRKTGARLRSPMPSPPTVSPSSSPSRSRFHVMRVVEVSPLTSPLAQTPPSHAPSLSSLSSTPQTVSCGSSRSVTIPTVSIGASYAYTTSSTSLPTSSSMPSMANVTSSTQSIKRYSASPRSRFLVSKIYEDPRVPLSNRCLPPITPPINLPPTPMAKHAPEPDLTSPETQVAAPLAVVEHIPESSPISTTMTTNPENSTNARVIAKTAVTETSTTTTAPTSTSTATTTVASTITNTSSSLSPLLSSTSSSSSSSSSTSPASSSSSCSSASSASSSSSFTPLGSSSENSEHNLPNLPATNMCPIAVFSDNDITLTKNSGNEAYSNVIAAAAATAACASSLTDEHPGADTGTIVDDPNAAQATQQQRVRKVSWISNPGVDKLRTLFQKPATIFQRSASPELKAATSPAQGNSMVESTSNCGSYPLQQNQNALVPSRKQSPPSWATLGTDLLSVSSDADTTNTVVTTAAAITEQTRSILEVPYFRQLRDLVLRQNLSFGNETNTSSGGGAILSSGAGSGAAENAVGGSTAVAMGSGAQEHDATLIPKEMKQEIKENISPEHTINEETLNSLQMLTCQSCIGTAVVSSVGDVVTQSLPTDLKTAEELKDTDSTDLVSSAVVVSNVSAIPDMEDICAAANSTPATAATTQIT